ncbi:MAG: UDP-N-acetylglucosamine--N-acetylmuramyl-(pentapeptide) pyrophosphoryl-undecaprenol N-acetylglucosamine transferase [Fimbriimonadaceae bacterium]|nr:UDP-N-acetylglucosamine--N-acetylmuramyl-(pentapeptide) pyrophosphoryl-undecaprenol N-acetylglucosamine transferase [Fimbriimonadaceae bacterium]
MKLVVTGGGTGGHVFPALEVARLGRDEGWDVTYLGSLRGQEASACDKARIPFQGFPSAPLHSLRSLRGWKSLSQLLRASRLATAKLKSLAPDAIFSTGGYASAPVVHAAGRLRIPYILHEQNSIPGRTNLMLARRAEGVATVFESTRASFPQNVVRRTGMPIRRELRDSEQGRFGIVSTFTASDPIVLVMGGSQGAAALNDVALATALRMVRHPVQWLHLTGVSHYESTMKSLRSMGIASKYEMRSYLEADEMASAYFGCKLAVCRSGAGTIAELAAFRRPSILVPFPHSFGQHQTANAREIADLGGALVVDQENLDPGTLESRILLWVNDPDQYASAQDALAKWDRPQAGADLVDWLTEVR